MALCVFCVLVEAEISSSFLRGFKESGGFLQVVDGAGCLPTPTFIVQGVSVIT